MSTWTTLKQFLTLVIGTYTPMTNTDGIGSLDIPYIMSAVLFILIVYLFIKVIFRIIR